MHAETVLLVDHGEPEIAELDALLEERVGADGDVDFARCERRKRGAPRAAVSRPVNSASRNPAASASALHALKMLAGEDFGRRHQRRLPSGLDDMGHRQQRDDRLARADVALQQPQHALRAPRGRRGWRRPPAACAPVSANGSAARSFAASLPSAICARPGSSRMRRA